MKKVGFLALLLLLALWFISKKPPTTISEPSPPSNPVKEMDLEAVATASGSDNSKAIPLVKVEELDEETKAWIASEEAWGVQHDREVQWNEEIVECEVALSRVSECENKANYDVDAFYAHALSIAREHQSLSGEFDANYSPEKFPVKGCITNRMVCLDPSKAVFVKLPDKKKEAWKKEIVKCDVYLNDTWTCENMKDLNTDKLMEEVEDSNTYQLVNGCVTERRNCKDPEQATFVRLPDPEN